MTKFIALSAVALMFPVVATAQTVTTPTPAPAPATTSTAPAEVAPAPAPAPVDVKTAIAAKIKTDWVKYDATTKGHLTRAELGQWLTDLRVAAGQPSPDAEWQKSAFVQTDTNKDTKVSVEELTAFLTAGA